MTRTNFIGNGHWTRSRSTAPVGEFVGDFERRVSVSFSATSFRAEYVSLGFSATRVDCSVLGGEPRCPVQ